LFVLPFTLTLFLSACQKWVPIQSAPPISSQVESTDVLRIYLTNGRVVELEHDTHIDGDSLIGFRERPGTFTRDPVGRTAIALDDIERLEEKRGDKESTGAILGGALIGLVLVGCAVDGEESGYGCPY